MNRVADELSKGAPEAPSLEVCDVSLRIGARVLLERVGFEAGAGEIVAIIGPNGAGKTTLLEALVGVRRADSGTMTFRGRAPRNFAERARTFAYLPDDADLPFELSVRTVVEHAHGFRPRPSAVVDELRNALGVPALFDMPCGQLSRGERQRVALFCALAADRPVVVLDEPFSAFDPLQLKDVLHAVRRVTEAGATIVTSIHQLGDTEKVADRVLFLAEGRRIAWGTLDSLRHVTNLPGASLENVFVALLERKGRAA
jgi:iron complex transport system ATP-binding protein